MAHDPEHMAYIGREGGMRHTSEHMRTIGQKGAQSFKEKMQDEDFRREFIRRSRMGKEFGVNLP